MQLLRRVRMIYTSLTFSFHAMYNDFHAFLKREKKFILEAAFKRFHSLGSPLPSRESAWSRESSLGAPWGPGPEGQPGGVVETWQDGLCPSVPLQRPSPQPGISTENLSEGIWLCSPEPLAQVQSCGLCALHPAWRGFGACYAGAGGWGASRGEAAGKGRCDLTPPLPPSGHGLQAFRLLSVPSPFSRSLVPTAASHL